MSKNKQIILAISIFFVGVTFGLIISGFAEKTDLSSTYNETVITGSERNKIEETVLEYVELVDKTYENGNWKVPYKFRTSGLFLQTVDLKTFTTLFENPIMQLTFNNVSELQVVEVNMNIEDLAFVRVVVKSDLEDVSTIDFSLKKNADIWEIVNFRTNVVDLQSTTLSNLQKYSTTPNI